VNVGDENARERSTTLASIGDELSIGGGDGVPMGFVVCSGPRWAGSRAQRSARCRAVVERDVLPRHVAIIPDGNGRWAEMKGMRRAQGHAAGAENMKEVVRQFIAREIPMLTVFVCSTENMSRDKQEVGMLLNLVSDALERWQDPNVALRWIGSPDKLPKRLRRLLERQTAEADASRRKMVLTIALNYGGRAEITSMAKRLARDVRDGRLDAEAIDESIVEGYMNEQSVYSPDLIIRTGGEKRLSNFLLWQCAYSELYFSDVLWPDFGRKELDKALEAYSLRKRRFGLVC